MNNNPFPNLHKQQFISLTTFRFYLKVRRVQQAFWEIKPAQEPTA